MLLPAPETVNDWGEKKFVLSENIYRLDNINNINNMNNINNINYINYIIM